MDKDRIIIIEVAERLDSAMVADFKLEAQLAMANAQAVVVDLADTVFIDSAGLGSLVSLLKSCTQKGVRLTLAGLTPQVKQIFELTRLYRLFDIFDSVTLARNDLDKV
jgi:anti-sigma B factor antagonist